MRKKMRMVLAAAISAGVALTTLAQAEIIAEGPEVLEETAEETKVQEEEQVMLEEEPVQDAQETVPAADELIEESQDVESAGKLTDGLDGMLPPVENIEQNVELDAEQNMELNVAQNNEQDIEEMEELPVLFSVEKVVEETAWVLADEEEKQTAMHQLTVRYLYSDGTEFDSFSASYEDGAFFHVTSPAVTGYFCELPEAAGEIREDLEIEVYYVALTYVLTVQFMDLEGNMLQDPYQTQLYYGDEYEIEVPDMTGYLPVQQSAAGTMPGRNETVTVFYVPAQAAAGTGEAEPEQAREEGQEKKTVSFTEVTAAGFPVISLAADGLIEETASANSQAEETITIEEYETPLGLGGSASSNAGVCIE